MGQHAHAYCKQSLACASDALLKDRRGIVRTFYASGLVRLDCACRECVKAAGDRVSRIMNTVINSNTGLSHQYEPEMPTRLTKRHWQAHLIDGQGISRESCDVGEEMIGLSFKKEDVVFIDHRRCEHWHACSECASGFQQ